MPEMPAGTVRPRTGKRLAIVQSNYVPWKGYFDLINLADEFILLDDAQYTKNDWRNRNQIKTPSGPQWLTIPVRVESLSQPIRETRVADPSWRRRHWKSLVQNYRSAPHFETYRQVLEELYFGGSEERLSAINFAFLTAVCSLLGIDTRFTWSMEYRLVPGRTERIVDLCVQAGAAEYISGPTARGYIDETLFEDAGVKLTYMDYSGYPEYRQMYPPFVHNVSILDLLLNEGPAAPRFLKSF